MRSATAVLAGLAVAVALAAIAGCAPAAGGDMAPTATAANNGRSTVSVYEELLGLIPAASVQGLTLVEMNDYALARELFDIPLPGPDGGHAAVLSYALAMSPYEDKPGAVMHEQTWISGLSFEALSQPTSPVIANRRELLGFDGLNVDQTLLTGVMGHDPRSLEVLRGRFDPEATEQALHACAEECRQPEVAEYLGVSYYTWGEDFATDPQRQDQPPIFDRYGRGSRLLVKDRYVFRTVYTEGMHGLIEAWRDAATSLADVEEFRLLARAMTGVGAYSATMGDLTRRADIQQEEPFGSTTFNHSDYSLASMVAIRDSAPLLRPYQALAVGRGWDANGGAFLAFALLHAEEDAARENAFRLEERIANTALISFQPDQPQRRWTDLVEGTDTTIDGRLLIAKLYGNDVARYTGDAFFHTEMLLVHE